MLWRAATRRRAFPLYVSQDGEDPGVQDVVYTHLKDLLYLQVRSLFEVLKLDAVPARRCWQA